MFKVLNRSSFTASKQSLTRINSQKKSISSSIFSGIFHKSVQKLNVNKEKVKVIDIKKEQFGTTRQWNPFYARKSSYERILEIGGNKSCPDCSSTDVCYVSTINGGVYCPVCAAIHRELGTHPDFLTLNKDIQVSNEDMQFYESMGNNYVNNIYEAALDVTGTNKPTITSSRCEITGYIQKKYLECNFSISPNDRPSTENVLYFVSNMKMKGNQIPNLREKTNERVGSTYKEIMDDAFASPYILQMAE